MSDADADPGMGHQIIENGALGNLGQRDARGVGMSQRVVDDGRASDFIQRQAGLGAVQDAVLDVRAVDFLEEDRDRAAAHQYTRYADRFYVFAHDRRAAVGVDGEISHTGVVASECDPCVGRADVEDRFQITCSTQRHAGGNGGRAGIGAQCQSYGVARFCFGQRRGQFRCRSGIECGGRRVERQGHESDRQEGDCFQDAVSHFIYDVICGCFFGGKKCDRIHRLVVIHKFYNPQGLIHKV